MATCTRCGTIMAATPGTKCPACGAVKDPPPAKVAAKPPQVAEPSRASHAPVRASPPPGTESQPAYLKALPLPLPNAIDRVAVGTTLLIWGGLALLASLVASFASEVLSSILQVPGFLAAVAGVLLVGHGLGFAKGMLPLLAIFMLVPGLNLVVAFGMVAIAAARLKEAGRRIEFPGVKLER